MRGSRFATTRGVNAREIRPRSFVWLGGSKKRNQFGGAVGTLSALGEAGPAVAAFLAEELSLPEPDLPWHAERDRIANVAALGIHCEVFVGEGVLEATTCEWMGLIVSELVMNAATHAYPGRDGGPIWVTMTRDESSRTAISVRDEGVGLTSGRDQTGKRLGMRIIAALAHQLGAEVTPRSLNPGTELMVSIPATAR